MHDRMVTTRVPLLLLDIALAAVTTVGVLVGTVLAGGQVNYASTLPLALALGLVLLVRRRWPVPVLLVSAQAVLAFACTGLFEAGWVWPASAAWFTVAAGDRMPRRGLAWAGGVGLVALAFAAGWESTVIGEDPQRTLATVGAEALWLTLIIAVATAYRNWLRWRAELSSGMRRAEREHELRMRQRTVEERLRIARELHDVVAHTLTVVGIQLRVVAEALDDSPAEARTALAGAQQVRARAVADLRSLVGVLRDDGDGDSAVPAPHLGLDGLAGLVDRVRASGVEVDLDVIGDLTVVPAPVALATYRIVQESLTNTVKHAQAGRAAVRLECTSGAVSVEVADDGAGPSPQAVAGHGVTGMRERVTALGGTFSAEPAGADGGYTVRATIPVQGSRS